MVDKKNCHNKLFVTISCITITENDCIVILLPVNARHCTSGRRGEWVGSSLPRRPCRTQCCRRRWPRTRPSGYRFKRKNLAWDSFWFCYMRRLLNFLNFLKPKLKSSQNSSHVKDKTQVPGSSAGIPSSPRWRDVGAHGGDILIHLQVLSVLGGIPAHSQLVALTLHPRQTTSYMLRIIWPGWSDRILHQILIIYWSITYAFWEMLQMTNRKIYGKLNIY